MLAEFIKYVQWTALMHLDAIQVHMPHDSEPASVGDGLRDSAF